MAKATAYKKRNVVDSSAWLAYFANEAEADHFAAAIEDSKNLVVPAIVLFEVFKKVLRERGDNVAKAPPCK